MSSFKDELARRIRRARRMSQLTQAELARKVSLSIASISSYENGTRNPSVETVALIAEACQVGICELVPRAELVTTTDADQTTIYDYMEGEA